jgi:soluble lytic murein transglycosylase-like protein
MSVTTAAAKLLFQTVLTLGSAGGLLYTAYVPPKAPAPVAQVRVQAPARSPEFEKAFFQAAKVYGKAGCGDQQLAEMTAKRAIETDLPPAIVAAVIASESTCNPMAVSNRGALGLMQVVPKIHGKHYDFSKINLLNPEQNMQVGTDILSTYVRQYGLKSGLRHFYGTGDSGIYLDGTGYADRVLALAGKV